MQFFCRRASPPPFPPSWTANFSSFFAFTHFRYSLTSIERGDTAFHFCIMHMLRKVNETSTAFFHFHLNRVFDFFWIIPLGDFLTNWKSCEYHHEARKHMHKLKNFHSNLERREDFGSCKKINLASCSANAAPPPPFLPPRHNRGPGVNCCQKQLRRPEVAPLPQLIILPPLLPLCPPEIDLGCCNAIKEFQIQTHLRITCVESWPAFQTLRGG